MSKKFIVLTVTIIVAFAALWQTNRVASQIRDSEASKIRLWASAISQKAQLVNTTEQFFLQVAQDEHRKMEMYTNILQSFNSPNMNSDLNFSLAYVNYIIDSSKTEILIVNNDSIITVPQELSGQKLNDTLLSEFSANPPFHYKIWGMPMTLYYKESIIYSNLRHALDQLGESFLSEITNNSVFVPVIIVDSRRCDIIGLGNIENSEVDTPEKLAARLSRMENSNQPIEIQLPDDRRAYVYYEDTPLLRAVQLAPVFYIFIALVLVIVSYNLFRTAHTMEQNRIWVGMAKETAHQLGTPISSLLAWTEYLRGKTFEDSYAEEVRKDLSRLETITHRFSKIGSVPELKEENVKEVIQNAITYLQNRSSRKVKFVTTFPDDEEFIAPINSYLFEWVIENICKNAIDAMNGAGTFSIVLSQDARQIYIDLSDTGKGIPQSMQKHIFESGFTTKQRGWGLGLSLARRIINDYHRGKIYLKYSVPGQGSTFRIVLKKSK
ncbi:MAG: HAMP domain-containing histidine kinase [Bacteroidales bacterium]|nr:HAMP domain-containing histidine kinase [Bacteroidales bacterium]